MEGIAGLAVEVLGDVLESPHRATSLGERECRLHVENENA